ncbi:uncharacterized protein HD556DRAFT_1461102 [Suillus plorans]|uniref:CCHC-type domain-containing protein n=1 Tax=Suillus plorans TaxID=116603 RepID=A0A9P7D9Y1_9AGAM|nr:uncharacterized protein HD556DRAFT_1461102 [Suillus plorans]KAG1784934.1 hypothetical protein HD556DRAFT_1461102 [Suillus plorans]
MTKSTSTMTYNTRSRTRARASSVSTPASEKNEPVRDDYGNFIVNIMTLAQKAAQGSGSAAGTQAPVESPLTSVEGSPGTEMESPSALRPTRSYSDVVRASSPGSDQTVAQESILRPKPMFSPAGGNKINELAESGGKRVRSDTAKEPELTSSDEDDDDRPWIQVSHKGRDRAKTPERLYKEPLRNSARRESNVSSQSTPATREMDLGEGTSKGKGVDPRNWGDAMLDEEDLNLEEQRAALESFKTAREIASQTESSSEGDLHAPLKGSGPKGQRQDIFEQAAREQRAVDHAVKMAENRLRKEYDQKLKEVLAGVQRPERRARVREPFERMTYPIDDMVRRVVNPKTNRREQRHTPQAMEPVHQVAPRSYIGQALGRLGRGGDDSSDSSFSDSSSSSSDETSSSSSDNEVPRKGSKRSKKRSKRKKGKTTLKLIAPATYDGAVDSRAFHRFITEGTAYVKDGKVKAKKRAFVLSHYLKGKAHEFYIREVSGDPYRWRLREFFMEMFNYCFPINFRTKQREKLKRCFQNDKTVRDYIYELNELWNMIGDVDDRDRVSRLWTGLTAEIQRELWKKELNPEVSTFKEVQAAAEIIEIAHSVPTGREKRATNKDKPAPVEVSSATAVGRSPKTKGTGRRRDRDRRPNPDDKSRGQRTYPGGNGPRGTGRSQPGGGINPEERERRKTEGRCYTCGELGHVSRQCPKNTHLKSDSPGKPPGIPSFGIHVGPSEEERMRQLTEVSEPPDGLFVGSVGLFMEESLPFEIPPIDPKRDEPSVRFRDPVARRAEDRLQGMQFPWDGAKDETHAVAWDDPDRFWVALHEDKDTYVVVDYHHGRYGPERMELSRQQLEDPQFRIDKAYWLHLGRFFGKRQKWDRRRLLNQERQRTNRREPMGTPIEDRIEWWLEEYIVHPEDYWSSSTDRRFLLTCQEKQCYNGTGTLGGGIVAA